MINLLSNIPKVFHSIRDIKVLLEAESKEIDIISNEIKNNEFNSHNFLSFIKHNFFIKLQNKKLIEEFKIKILIFSIYNLLNIMK